MTFKKVTEDFICEHCNTKVTGNGFTNHCPKCLWGKHVDIHPGDRAESCGGLMEPIAITSEREGESVIHRCLRCGKEGKNRLSKSDDYSVAIAIAKKKADAFKG